MYGCGMRYFRLVRRWEGCRSGWREWLALTLARPATGTVGTVAMLPCLPAVLAACLAPATAQLPLLTNPLGLNGESLHKAELRTYSPAPDPHG